VPGGYDFARVAWFQGIGATGKALGPIKLHPAHEGGFWAWLSDTRQRLSAHIDRSIDGVGEGGVATSFVTGDQGSISLYTIENGAMRLTGERPATAKQPAMRHRITWTPLPDGKVRQLWESTPASKEHWTVQFDGLYELAN